MKKSRKGLGLLVLGLVVVAALAVSQNSSVLQGFFSPKISSLCPTLVGKTIYVQEGATGAKTGTKAAPYDSIASAQTALETDSTIKRVCFSGALTGSLDLDASLATNLTLTAYTAGASLESPDTVIHMESGVLDKLNVNNLKLTGTMALAPATSLTMSKVEVHGDGRENALWVGSADTVTISNSSFDDTDVAIDTTHWEIHAVGSLTVSDTTFSNIVDAAISAYYLDSLTVDGSTFDTPDVGAAISLDSVASASVDDSDFSYYYNGVESRLVDSLSVTKSTFTGGLYALMIYSAPSTGTVLDVSNNFILNNRYAGLANSYLVKVTGEIYNNSFYNNRFTTSFSGITKGDVVHTNNIFFATVGDAAFGNTSMVAELTSDYNLFYGSPALNASTLVDWQSATGLDTHSRYGDPLFTSTTDLHLFGSGSPAIDYGTDLSSVTDDIDGDARSSGSYDMGADEY